MEQKNGPMWSFKNYRASLRNTVQNLNTSSPVQGINKIINLNLGTIDQPQYVSYFKTYFDFGYYLCVIPFRFRKDPSLSAEFILYKNRGQQVVCALRHLLTLYVRITFLRIAYSDDGPRVIYYFELLQSITIILYHLAFYNILWRSEEKIQHVIQQTTKCSKYKKFKLNHKTKIIIDINKATILCTVAATISIVCPFVGHNLPETFSRSPSNIFASYLQLGKYALFLEANATLSPEKMFTDPGQMSVADWFLILFQFIATASYFSVDFFTSLAALIAAEALLDATECFIERIHSYEIPMYTFESILEHFEELKEYAGALNKVLGPLIIVYVVDSVAYFSVNLDELLVEADWFAKFVALYFVIHDVSVLYSSGRICEEVDKFFRWLVKREHQDVVSSPKMIVLLADLSSTPVAIKGHEKFSIDNAFIGNVMVVLIILFAIVLQSKPNFIEDKA